MPVRMLHKPHRASGEEGGAMGRLNGSRGTVTQNSIIFQLGLDNHRSFLQILLDVFAIFFPFLKLCVFLKMTFAYFQLIYLNLVPVLRALGDFCIFANFDAVVSAATGSLLGHQQLANL